jgi:hypothetical protein
MTLAPVTVAVLVFGCGTSSVVSPVSEDRSPVENTASSAVSLSSTTSALGIVLNGMARFLSYASLCCCLKEAFGRLACPAESNLSLYCACAGGKALGL